MIKPVLAPKDVPLKISAAIVFQAVKSILQAGKEQEFLAEADKHQSTVVASPEVVNLVKSFLFAHNVHETDLAASTLIQSPPGQDRCPPAIP